MATKTDEPAPRVLEIEDELDTIWQEQLLADFAFNKALRDAQRRGWSPDFQKNKADHIAATNERAKRRAALLTELDELTR